MAHPPSDPAGVGVDGGSSGEAPAALVAATPLMPLEEHIPGGLLPSGLQGLQTVRARKGCTQLLPVPNIQS